MTKKHSPKQSSKSLKDKTAFSKYMLIAFAVVFGAIGSYILFKSFAAAPTPPAVYLTPASQPLAINSNFSVQVRENSGATTVNAVQANFSYNASLVDFVSIDTTGTAFTTDAPSSGGSGQVSIARGLIGSTTGDQLVATVNFRTKAVGGTVAMAFTSGTALVSYSTSLDLLGSLAATAGGSYTIDTTPPTVTVTAPANGATISLGTTTSITATSTDTTSTIPSVDIYVDGTLKTTVNSPGPYTYSWNTTGLSLGSHTIQAKSTDSTGNLGVSSVLTVTIADQTAPSAPTALHATSSTTSSIAIAWTASTDNVGVTGYRIQRGGVTLTTTASLAYSDSGLAANTSYTYTVTALDGAGNASSVATLTTSTPSLAAGDINGDGKVDIFDLTRLAVHYGATSAGPNWDAASDLNHNNIIDIFDLSILARNWAP